MAKDISGGFIQVNERTLRRLSRPQIEQLIAEINKRLRDVRSQQPDLKDVQALRGRNTQIKRLNGALRIAQALRQGPKSVK